MRMMNWYACAKYIGGVIGDVYMLYSFNEKEEHEWYACVMYCIHSYRKGSMNGVRVFCVLFICRRRGVRMVYVCS